nr:hypothetical protein [Tanacetum cinerariifolium]
MANVPLNDPNVDAPAIVPAPVNPNHAPAQPVSLGDGFAPHWIGNNIPNNQNGWIEEDAEEEEEDPEEDLKEDPEEEPEDDDDDMEMDDEVEVIDPYIDDGSNNPPPLNSEDEETPHTSPIIPDADGQPIPPIASFGQNFYFDESSSTENLLTGNSKIVLTGPMCLNLGTVWKRLGKMEKLMSERIDTEGRIKKKFKEQDRHFLGLVQEPPAKPSARPVPAPYPDDPYVVTRDAAIADAAIATSGIDDDDDTAPTDSQPHEPRGSPRDMQTMPPRKRTRGNPPPLLTHDTVNRMIQESVKAAIRAERERVQNEANRAEGPNVAPVARECTFADFMKCSPITFRGNEGAVGLIRWIQKTEMVFTVSKCTEANKVVFVVATFQDRALTWWNSQVATLGIEVVTRKMWAEMKVMMMEEFYPPEEIQRMESELWNLRVKEMDISSYT